VKDVDHPRVGTCLDTCHAMMETELMRWMRMYLGFKQDDIDKFKPTNIEDFFEENKDTIKWMHLANSKSHGLGKCHGLPFTELDIDCLRNILRLYRKYKYNCPMVIEVREEDYSDAKNYATTCQMIDMVLQELE
jgi:sugar phosphate isomerase/epimerase